MNSQDNSQSAPPMIPPIPPSTPAPAIEDPSEQLPVAGPIGVVESLLRQPRRLLYHLGNPNERSLFASMLGVTVVCSLIYGVAVGMFSGSTQLWAAPLKITVGMLITGVICLPSLYIFVCLMGSRARLAEVVGIVAGMLALTAILLVGFAPVAWVFSQSTESIAGMGFLYLLFWAIAMWFGVRFLYAGFRKVKSGNGVLPVWVGIFVLVALQMTTALRPIVGKSDTFLPVEKKFFVAHWMDCVDGKAVANPDQPNGSRR